MKKEEQKYSEEIESIIENLGGLQRKFVLDKTGIRAIIKFIEDLEGRRPFFDLDDPVVQKGKSAAGRVTEGLEKQLKQLQALSPPAGWADFHECLTGSIQLQLDGYKEMVLVFEDSNMDHITEGQDSVNRGMKLLEECSGKE